MQLCQNDHEMIRRVALLICLTFVSAGLAAQELEPRAYSNAPVGLRFLVLAYGHSAGDLVFDPTKVVALLNHYLSVMVEPIHKSGGTIDEAAR